MAQIAQHRLLTIDDILTHWAAEQPDAPAIEGTGHSFSYGELDRLSRQIIALLAARGIGAGDRVAFLGKNAAAYGLLYCACARAGIVIAPVGWRLAPREIAYILADTGAKLLVAAPDFEELAGKAMAELASPPELLGDAAMLEAARACDPAPFTPCGADDPILQLYTSGTTGHPKGVLLSNANLTRLRNEGIAAGLTYYTDYRPGDCMMVAMPIAHIGGTGTFNLAIIAGIRCRFEAEFTPAGVLEAIEAGTTHMFLVPAALQMVIQHPQAASTDFSNLRYLIYGAAPMPLELLKQAVQTMPNTQFLQAYGMTETTGTVSILPPEDHTLEGNQRMRSAGRALPGVAIEVRGPDNVEVPRGEIGEVCILSPSNTAGYWKLPEATAKTIDPDGWLHTGDAGVMDEDGYVYIQDRIKDMIISGGENVYPAEVESAIYGHPAIAEVAVIGVPSAKWGEEVKACVVPKPGCEVDEADVIAWARERIAAFKAPKSVDIIPMMPRNASGKILRRELRAPYWEGQERQVS
ncbi:long-chain-fatty-acid--CoA ligase [Porphyrobacter sp. CACIAM 03H1]|jgi:acyl-CoA synthetase (AMP-forming)/AMP-acid ligase II|uniref:long-chain-fatty-acid--CoA ligase n=1 Tax=Porphyrobacter sp. CACIAM 03H1 TaxID=2003315 RepID=UPI000B5A5804|nr:long-chain-fatty-acid--CoA ligase [Porphyrobacter sp. CACIAM 03H1]ASJ90740.1 acyl-CoA synthetase [Porphyrobacter sp. CACIAM 03H1]